MPATAHPGKSLLLIEDDDASREALAAALEGAGCRVARVAHNGEAQRLMRDGPRPDLILLDLGLAVTDSREFARLLDTIRSLVTRPELGVLVVDDEPQMREMLELALAHHGFTVW